MKKAYNQVSIRRFMRVDKSKVDTEEWKNKLMNSLSIVKRVYDRSWYESYPTPLVEKRISDYLNMIYHIRTCLEYWYHTQQNDPYIYQLLQCAKKTEIQCEKHKSINVDSIPQKMERLQGDHRVNSEFELSEDDKRVLNDYQCVERCIEIFLFRVNQHFHKYSYNNRRMDASHRYCTYETVKQELWCTFWDMCTHTQNHLNNQTVFNPNKF